jgi:hypothetical protein
VDTVKRLREEFDPTDPNEAYGAAILAKVPPLEPSTARQHRVRFALRSSKVRMALRLSPAVVAGIVILGATGASAMVARYFVRTHVQAHELMAPAADPGQSAPRPTGPAGRAARPTTPSIGTTPDSTDGALVASPAPEPMQKDPAPLPRPAKTRIALPGAAAGTAAPAPGAALMIEAMQARRSGDMARAARLLSEYRSKYPDGDLQEEALALSIEAAVARGDESARSFAAQYLKRYPGGRFHDQAERALQSTPR